MTRFTSNATSSLAAFACAAAALYACSFQEFDYLQEGAAGAAALDGKGGTAGASGGAGGNAASGGSSAGSNPVGGTTGEEAGQAGQAGSPGASGEGGAPAGGTSAGATSSGGVPAAQGGEGGVPDGAGGDPVVGSGGGAGIPSDGGAGGEPPVVGSSVLVNPGFELGLQGWTVDPASAALPANRYIYTQPHNTQNELVGGGSSQLATWHATDEYSVTIYQRLTDLEPGTYTFRGWFSSTSTRQAYVFARNCEEPDMPDITVDIPAVAWEWFEVVIPSFNVSADSCEVGLFVHAIMEGNNGMPDWLNADLFSFEKDP